MTAANEPFYADDRVTIRNENVRHIAERAESNAAEPWRIERAKRATSSSAGASGKRVCGAGMSTNSERHA